MGVLAVPCCRPSRLAGRCWEMPRTLRELAEYTLHRIGRPRGSSDPEEEGACSGSSPLDY